MLPKPLPKAGVKIVWTFKKSLFSYMYQRFENVICREVLQTGGVGRVMPVIHSGAGTQKTVHTRWPGKNGLSLTFL